MSVIVILFGIILLVIKNHKAIQRALGLRVDMESLVSEACEKQKDMYKQLGIPPKCTRDSCPADQTPTQNNGCEKEGYVVRTNAANGNKCCMPSINPPPPSDDNTSVLENVAHFVTNDWQLIIEGTIMHEYIKGCIKQGILTTTAKGGELLIKVVRGSPNAVRIAARATKQGFVRAGEITAKIAKDVIEKGLKKTGEKIAISTSEALFEAASTGLTICATTGAESAGLGCVAGLVWAAVQFVALVGPDIVDATGTKQYIDNKDGMLTMRNSYEGPPLENVNVTRGTDKPVSGSPFIFGLDQISLIPTFSLLSDNHPLNEIFLAYQAGYTKYLSDQVPGIISNLTDEIKENLLVELTSEGDESGPDDGTGSGSGSGSGAGDNVDSYTIFMQAVTDKVDMHFKERDKAIWKLMTQTSELKISGNMGEYVMYDERLSGFREPGDDAGKHHCGISLNEKGVDLYNKEVDKSIGKKDSVLYLVFSKYYRVLGTDGIKDAGTPQQRYVLTQKALPVAFAQISFSKGAVQSACEDGYDPATLQKLYPIRNALGANRSDTHWAHLGPTGIKPSDYYVSYDQDTGVCKYDTKNPSWDYDGYCTYMDKGDDPEMLTFPCEGDGCTKNSFQNCKEVSGVAGDLKDIFGFGVADWPITEGRRAVGELERFVDPDVKLTSDEKGAFAGIAGGAATGAIIGSLGGPLDPVTVPFGVVVGGIAGGIAGFFA